MEESAWERARGAAVAAATVAVSFLMRVESDSPNELVPSPRRDGPPERPDAAATEGAGPSSIGPSGWIASRSWGRRRGGVATIQKGLRASDSEV